VYRVIDPLRRNRLSMRTTYQSDNPARNPLRRRLLRLGHHPVAIAIDLCQHHRNDGNAWRQSNFQLSATLFHRNERSLQVLIQAVRKPQMP